MNKKAIILLLCALPVFGQEPKQGPEEPSLYFESERTLRVEYPEPYYIATLNPMENGKVGLVVDGEVLATCTYMDAQLCMVEIIIQLLERVEALEKGAEAGE